MASGDGLTDIRDINLLEKVQQWRHRHRGQTCGHSVGRRGREQGGE